MKEITIKHLAYSIKNNQSKPIFFLGAGASRSGQIPLAGEITSTILEKYADSPFIADLPAAERTYAKLMECLQPAQRNELLKNYIDNAKINVTHIYLAKLLHEGYVDFVLTVNFDNLMLRALALYNIFPPTYDIAILQDLTTSQFKEKSVIYLHGQSHGFWLLNTEEEMEKVANIVPRIFDAIKHRPWVFIGYSGEDPIFDHIQKLGRADNGLYWVCYQNHDPSEKVQKFLSAPNQNTYIIKGYDGDSFMVKLNNELGLEQPEIIDKPFTALSKTLSGIVDINDEEHFAKVKERLTIAQKQVGEAILHFEQGKKLPEKTAENEHDLLAKEILNLIASEQYDESIIAAIEAKVLATGNDNLKILLAGLIYNWGIALYHLAQMKQGKEAESLYLQAIKKNEKVTQISPNYSDAFNNWGIALYHLAQIKQGKEAENLYSQAIEKYEKATQINPNLSVAFNNWGNALVDLAQMKQGQEAENLYSQTFEKYHKATQINPDYSDAFYNWGIALHRLAQMKQGQEVESLYLQAIEKYKKATQINPNYSDAFYNWGIALYSLAKIKQSQEAENLYSKAIEKYKKATQINPNLSAAFNNWALTLINLAKMKQGQEVENLYLQAIEKYHKVAELSGKVYNLACLYAIRGNKQQALKYLEISLQKQEQTVAFVEKDADWDSLRADQEFIALLQKYQ